MNTLLVPVDFSETAIHAARYAAALSRQLNPARIVLYHSSITTPAEGNAEKVTIREEAEKELDNLVLSLKVIAPATEYALIVNDGYLLENIQELVKTWDAFLIVMGITGKNKLEQKLIGSNTTKIARQSGYPVLIIPPGAEYKTVEQMVLALPFKADLLETIPSEDIKHCLRLLQAKLTLLNIEEEDDDTPGQYVYAGQQAAHLMFDQAGAVFQLSASNNIVRAIADYILVHNVQIVISVTEEHGFFNQLFKGSTTDHLAYQTTIPLLVFKAKTPQ